MHPIELSIIIPMMNEAESLDLLFCELIPPLETLSIPYEILCVDDGSSDTTVEKLIALQKHIPQIVILELSRNFGKEAALTAGLHHMRGQAAVPLDADLQDPPDLIADMVRIWKGGADVVLAVRKERVTDTWFKRTSAGAFYRVINAVSDIDVPHHAGDFRLMDRRVVEAFRQLPERSRFNKGIFAWLGFKTETLFYDRPVRQLGTTKWRLRRLWSFAIDGITSFSSLPLRIWSYIGFSVAASALVYGSYIIIRALTGDRDVPGYASLMTVLLFSNGLLMIGLGAIGEYLSRVFIEVKGRPVYIIRRRIESGVSREGTKID